MVMGLLNKCNIVEVLLDWLGNIFFVGVCWVYLVDSLMFGVLK